MPLKESLRIYRQILSSVEAVHNMNMIHRDVKPGNILLTKSNDVKLADFGLSKMFKEEDELGESVFNEVVYYFPPESALKRG